MQAGTKGAKRNPEGGSLRPSGPRELQLKPIDLSILRGMLNSMIAVADLRKPAALVAKELGVDEATVRGRLRRWEESGFLVKYAATVNRTLAGQAGCFLRLEVPEGVDKADVVEKVKLVDGVHRVVDYYGRTLSADIFYDPSQGIDAASELVSALAGGAPVTAVEYDIPPSGRRLGITDLLILGSIGWSARKSYAEIARETGLAAKTVKKRLEMLAAAQAIHVGLFLDYTRVAGVFLGDLFVTLREGSQREKARRETLGCLDGRILTSSWLRPDVGSIRVLLTNLSQQREILERVKGVKGVRSASLDLVVTDIFVVEAFYKLERRMLEEATRGKNAPPRLFKLWAESWRPSTRDLYSRAD